MGQLQERLTAEAAVPPDGWLEPLVLAGIFKGLQSITKSTEEFSEFTEAVHTLQQEGPDGYPGGTMGPGRTLEGSQADSLGFLKVSGPAFSIHDLLLFHLDVLLFHFLATRMGKARIQKSWARWYMPAIPALGSGRLESQKVKAGAGEIDQQVKHMPPSLTT